MWLKFGRKYFYKILNIFLIFIVKKEFLSFIMRFIIQNQLLFKPIQKKVNKNFFRLLIQNNYFQTLKDR